MPAAPPKPGTFRWRVLEWLVRNGDGTVGELADSIEPPPRFSMPIRNGREYRHRQQVRAQHRADVRGRVRVSLSALQRCGLVETAGGARLEDWALDAWRTRGPEAVIRHVWDTGFTDGTFDADMDPDDVVGEESPGADGTLALEIIRSLSMGPRTRKALCKSVTGRTRESGAFERAYARLVDRGVIAPPSLRRPTEAGRAMVSGSRLQLFSSFCALRVDRLRESYRMFVWPGGPAARHHNGEHHDPHRHRHPCPHDHRRGASVRD